VKLRNERGQTMVELALCLPVICLLLFGVIQFGIVFNNYVTLTDAVRAGARKATVSRDLGAIAATAAAKQSVHDSAPNLDQSKLLPSVTSSWVHGNDVTVTATYPYSINLLGVVVSSGNLTSSTTERVE
jgi:Flp pilus assembly protein TadG